MSILSAVLRHTFALAMSSKSPRNVTLPFSVRISLYPSSEISRAVTLSIPKAEVAIISNVFMFLQFRIYDRFGICRRIYRLICGEIVGFDAREYIVGERCRSAERTVAFCVESVIENAGEQASVIL